jgi:hypothetical protein
MANFVEDAERGLVIEGTRMAERRTRRDARARRSDVDTSRRVILHPTRSMKRRGAGCRSCAP